MAAVQDLKSTQVIQHDRQISLVRFSPCGRFLCGAGRDGLVHCWVLNPESNNPESNNSEPNKPAQMGDTEPVKLSPLKGHDGWVTHLQFVPSTESLISCDSWGRLICWTYDSTPSEITWKMRWEAKGAHDGWIRQVAVSPNGQRVASCGADRTIRIWSAVDGQPINSLDAGEDTYALAFHPDGNSLVTGDLKGRVCDWDWQTGTLRREFDVKIMYLLSYIQDVGGVRVLVFSPDGKTLAVAGAQPATGGFVEASPIVRFFDWTEGKELRTVKLGEKTEGYVLDLHEHQQHFWIGVCSGQPGRGRFFMLKAEEDKPFFEKQLPNCHSVALHPSRERMAVVSNEGTFGQRKSMAREGIYPGNTSPIHMFDLPAELIGVKESTSDNVPPV